MQPSIIYKEGTSPEKLPRSDLTGAMFVGDGPGWWMKWGRGTAHCGYQPPYADGAEWAKKAVLKGQAV